ncbi:MAG TPA: hypothetical protein VN673_12815 [Clostridia bacterium]|nr:hypothetical protein [Clostridia bacterium]
MISRHQQILVKRAQREAGLVDDEYRDALQVVSGCRSTKDEALADRHVDLVLAYMEAIFWRKVDAGDLPAPCSGNAVFRQRGYWQRKNPRGNTSRDRYAQADSLQGIAALESSLAELGYGADYCAAIRAKMAGNQINYRAALSRTLKVKQRKVVQEVSDNEPF